MLVIWDGAGGRRVFQRPLEVIRADSPADVPGALRAIEAALGQGNHIAGWLGYELGYALEARLAGLVPAVPLLRLGVFQAPESQMPRLRETGFATLRTRLGFEAKTFQLRVRRFGLSR